MRVREENLLMDGKCSNHCIQNKMKPGGYNNANRYGDGFEGNEGGKGEREAVEMRTR